MLIVLSPAKRLDTQLPPNAPDGSLPRLSEDVRELARVTARLTGPDLRRLMGLSDDLAVLNRTRFRAFDPDGDQGTPAVLTFAGDVYQGLKARELDAEALNWAQRHLRILSGLYGVLRPLDRIQPYRLEMGTRLKTRRGATLYDFWGDRIARQLTEDGRDHADPSLVNLASDEYFGAVDAKALGLPLIDVRFEEENPDGSRQVISFYAKTARGRMARWAIDRRVDKAETLKGFDAEGYRFDPAASTPDSWTFVRPRPEPKSASARSS